MVKCYDVVAVVAVVLLEQSGRGASYGGRWLAWHCCCSSVCVSRPERTKPAPRQQAKQDSTFGVTEAVQVPSGRSALSGDWCVCRQDSIAVINIVAPYLHWIPVSVCCQDQVVTMEDLGGGLCRLAGNEVFLQQDGLGLLE